jgi:hypothetical protein
MLYTPMEYLSMSLMVDNDDELLVDAEDLKNGLREGVQRGVL